MGFIIVPYNVGICANSKLGCTFWQYGCKCRNSYIVQQAQYENIPTRHLGGPFSALFLSSSSSNFAQMLLKLIWMKLDTVTHTYIYFFFFPLIRTPSNHAMNMGSLGSLGQSCMASLDLSTLLSTKLYRCKEKPIFCCTTLYFYMLQNVFPLICIGHLLFLKNCISTVLQI